MLKLTDNPPMLPPDVASPADLKGTWWVAHTRSRSEKALAWDLLRRNVGHFLPMAVRSTISGGRKRTVLTPVFPSYVFFCGSTDDRHAVLTTGRVCQVIPVPQPAMLVRELEDLHRAVGAKMRLDPYPFAAVGRRCRVARGPLRGTEGTVVRKDDVFRLLLQVSMLGQAVGVEMTADLLEPLD